MSHYIATQFEQCSRKEQTWSCFNRHRWDFNNGFIANYILNLHSQRRLPNCYEHNSCYGLACTKKIQSYNQLSRNVVCYFKPNGFNSVFQIEVKSNNIIPIFLHSLPMVRVSEQDSIRPRYMVISCVKGPNDLNNTGYFHQQFVLKVFYLHMNPTVLLQVYGEDTQCMHNYITINETQVKLTPLRSSESPVDYIEFFMGNENCVEHYSNYWLFRRLFLSDKQDSVSRVLFRFTFDWLAQYPILYDDKLNCNNNKNKNKHSTTLQNSNLNNEIKQDFKDDNIDFKEPPKKKRKL